MNRFTPHPTPNPDSLKVTTTGGPFTARGMESFRSAADAAGHPLAEALFSIAGVANVFMVPEFITVTKDRDVPWESLWPSVLAALHRSLGDNP